MSQLFQPTKVGSVEVKNRVFMAPLTRSRADNDTDTPANIAIEYYAQRAGAGLIISEATQISPMGKGYIKTPGIYTDEHVKAWKKITDAVHEKGGKIFLQLWHVGRISHTSLLPDNKEPFAPSAIQADTQTFTEDGQTQCSKPKAMSIDEIKQTVQEFKDAAVRAMDAGFDGVEVHGANGYLINQFLETKSNHRTDEYGGDVKGRSKFLFEVLDAVLSVWPADKVGLRLSPTGQFNDVRDEDPVDHYLDIIKRLNPLKLAYVHFVEQFPGMEVSNQDLYTLTKLIDAWDGFYIANGDYDYLRATAAVASGRADAITFGRKYTANPDLAKRLEIGAPLNTPDEDTFYQGGEKGYIDYPFLTEEDCDKAVAA